MIPYKDSLRVSSPPFWRQLPVRCSLPRLSSSHRILRPWSLGHAGAWHRFVGRIRTWWLQLRGSPTVVVFEVIGMLKRSTFCNTHLFFYETQVVKFLTLLTGQLDRFGHCQCCESKSTLLRFSFWLLPEHGPAGRLEPVLCRIFENQKDSTCFLQMQSINRFLS